MSNDTKKLSELADEVLTYFLEIGNFAEKSPNELAAYFRTDTEMINQAITLINGHFEGAVYIEDNRRYFRTYNNSAKAFLQNGGFSMIEKINEKKAEVERISENKMRLEVVKLNRDRWISYASLLLSLIAIVISIVSLSKK